MNINSSIFARLINNKRRSWILYLILFSICLIVIVRHQSDDIKCELETPVLGQSLSFDEVKLLLDQLFSPLIPLVHLQSIWNKLMETWHSILSKFVQDACDLCHQDESDCYESIDLIRYIYYINQSFYPFNETKRPIGMGLYYHFDLKTLHSLNSSILPTDVSQCDYFHMIQLMINVQIILHQAQIKYFLTKGTLIGVLRHHDVIPWDTDIDLFIPLSATKKVFSSFREVKVLSNKISTTTGRTKTTVRPSYQQDLVVYRFRNVHRVTSYKIFSLRSSVVPRTNYRWPKIDIFPYEENATHIYAFPKHKHNLGTMNYITKSNIEPLYLRLLGPLLVPSPYNLGLSLGAMVKLGPANLFSLCVGNTFLHRYNRGASVTRRIPCQKLHKTYPFVKSERNVRNGLCSEQLIFSQQNQSLSLYKYKCRENLRRTL